MHVAHVIPEVEVCHHLVVLANAFELVIVVVTGWAPVIARGAAHVNPFVHCSAVAVGEMTVVGLECLC
jgi:hypothetical protein